MAWRRGGCLGRVGKRVQELEPGLGSAQRWSLLPVTLGQAVDLSNHSFLKWGVEQIILTPKYVTSLFKLGNIPQSYIVRSLCFLSRNLSDIHFLLGSHLPAEDGKEGRPQGGRERRCGYQRNAPPTPPPAKVSTS